MKLGEPFFHRSRAPVGPEQFHELAAREHPIILVNRLEQLSIPLLEPHRGEWFPVNGINFVQNHFSWVLFDINTSVSPSLPRQTMYTYNLLILKKIWWSGSIL